MKKQFLYMMAVVLVASSCNKDEVITTTVDDFYRARTESSKSEFSKVFEYTPAPGQFINETRTGGFDGSQTTPEAAVRYAQQRMRDNMFVSLGGFGGYIVVGFDHSIDNIAGYDIAIKGNAFKGSSEPGIVWVMQDENGNSLPDDTWHELKGCETGKSTTIQNYSVTYFRPEGEQQPVKWKDSEGNEGEIDYLRAYHSQPFYYPAWISGKSYTLQGTFLKPKNFDQSGNGTYWVQEEYDWGYADNFSPSDYCDKEPLKGHNLFDISNAIAPDGSAKEMKFIDFIKVQTGCNTKSGWLGENSTEVFGFFDYSMLNKAN